MLSDVRPLLLLGLGIAAGLTALAVALDLLAGFGEWRTNAYLLNVLAMLVFAALAVRIGHFLPEHAGTRAAYAESAARSVSHEAATTIERHNSFQPAWLWPLLPLFITLLLISFSS